MIAVELAKRHALSNQNNKARSQVVYGVYMT